MSKIRGKTHALYVLTVFSNQRYEFIFTDMQTNKVREFESVFEIYRLYQSSYLYRELKLRGAIVTNGQLIILPQEQVYNTINGVWNLSSDQGNLGTFIISNIRLIWFADINNTFNISLPHMQISSVYDFNFYYNWRSVDFIFYSRSGFENLNMVLLLLFKQKKLVEDMFLDFV